MDSFVSSLTNGSGMDFLKFQLRSSLVEKMVGKNNSQIKNTIMTLVVLSSTNYVTDTLVPSLRSKSIVLFWKLIHMLVRYYKLMFDRKKALLVERRAVYEYIEQEREINRLYDAVYWKVQSMVQEEELDTLYYTKKNDNASVTRSLPDCYTLSFNFHEHKFNVEISRPIKEIQAEKTYKRENPTITITTDTSLSRKKFIFDEFNKVCQDDYNKYLETQRKIRKSYKNNSKGEWSGDEITTNRKYSSLVLREGQKEDIVSDLSNFIEEEDFYKTSGTPYTRCHFYVGSPGSGKSSMAHAHGCELNRDMYFLLHKYVKNDEELMNLLSKVEWKKAVFVIEELDLVISDIKKREMEKEQEKEKTDERSPDRPVEAVKNNKDEGITLKGLLYILNGITENYGGIFIFTTNSKDCLKNMDDAFSRSGRIDRFFYFDTCDDYQLNCLFRNITGRDDFYPLKIPVGEDGKKKQIITSGITNVLIRYRKQPEKAHEIITKFLNSEEKDTNKFLDKMLEVKI